jgi:predicted component of viral defense system (DUF524 family)
MRTFHRLKFSWESAVRLEIECARGSEGALVQPPEVPYLIEVTEENQPDRHAQRGIPAICWRETSQTLFEPLQLRENTEYLIDVTFQTSVAEAEALWREDNSWPLRTLGNAYHSEPPKRWLKNGNWLTVTGRLNFGSYVGIAEVCAPNVRPVSFEVACTKMGSFDDFRALLESIAEEYAGLLLEIESPTFSLFSLTEASGPGLLTFLFLLRHIMDESALPSAIENILFSMRSRIHTKTNLKLLGRIREPLEGDVFQRLRTDELQRGGPLASMFGGYTPNRLIETTKFETFDTPENRFVKSFLEDLLDRAETLRDQLVEQRREVTGRQVEHWCLQISDWLRHSSWSEVGAMTHFPSNSQVLLKAVGYRDVLDANIQLHLGLSLPWDSGLWEQAEVHGDLRPISRLYEYWCFFLLRRILRDLCGQEIREKSTFVREVRGGLSLVLRKGTESSVEFEYHTSSQKKAIITLFYNRKFTKQGTGSTTWDGTYSAIFNPDYSLRIIVDDGKARRLHWLHFDAKYRLDFELWEAEVEGDIESDGQPVETDSPAAEEAEIREIYKRTDLFKMHTYRDALLGSRGSYILYPGSERDKDIFIRYPGIEYPNSGPNIPSVGAFQARPTKNPAQAIVLKGFIKDCLDWILSKEPYQEEEGLFSPD